jgi:glycine/D-amino acid oxidase-like deaminating enzyme
MTASMTPREVDAAVIGGGFYGLRVALFLREELKVPSVRVFERESTVMERASFINQARVHNGYHYPRSILTAYRSRVNFPRFVNEYGAAIVGDFDHFYAIARVHSKVNARQFEIFCARIGAYIERAPKNIAALFDPARVESSYVVHEPALDSRILRDLVLQKIEDVGGIEIGISDPVESIAGLPYRHILIHAASGDYRAGRVVGSTYSQSNMLHRASGLEPIPLQHEVSEMALVTVPEALRHTGITIMDGPFFSLMPFPSRGLHTLSHVRFTPQYRWRDSGDDISNPQQVLDASRSKSGFPAMRADAMRYVPSLGSMTQVDSMKEIKTVLASSDRDDSRPILFRTDHGIPNYTCVMGGKLDNIYDALSELGLSNAA